MADDEYNKKLETLQQYIPFLDNMISQLKDPSKSNREQQLKKMESLHAMITDRKKKLKLETLKKCEDVISQLYFKVNHKPFPKKISENSPLSTPASPSPPPESKNFFQPITIPTERLESKTHIPKVDVYSKAHIPKVDVYSSAAESLRKLNNHENKNNSDKLPDLSKPPISIDDLKCLEEDVHDKINENASLEELTNIRNKIATELIFENIKCIKNPSKAEICSDFNVNDTKQSTEKDEKHNTSINDDNSTRSTKPISMTIKQRKIPKVLKEPASVFGNVLSHIDEQIIEENKKKHERRVSVGNDDKKNKYYEKDKVISKHNENESKKNTETEISIDEIDIKLETKVEREKIKMTDIIPVDDDIIAVSKILNKSIESTQSGPIYKRLADKYNPRPRRPATDATDGDKTITQTKYSSPASPVKIAPPSLPPPPPASLVKCAQLDLEYPKPLMSNFPNKPLLSNFQMPMSPNPYMDNGPRPLLENVQGIKPLMSSFQAPPKSPNPYMDNGPRPLLDNVQNIKPLMSSFQAPPKSPNPYMDNGPRPLLDNVQSIKPLMSSFQAPPKSPNPYMDNGPRPLLDNVQSIKPLMGNFQAPPKSPNPYMDNTPKPVLGNLQRSPLLNNSPLLQNPSILQSPRDNFISEYAREEYNQRRPQYEPPQSVNPNNRFGPKNSSHRFIPSFNNYNNKTYRDPTSSALDFQPPRDTGPTLQYNGIPPLLSPEIPHYPEPKHNFAGGIVNREIYLPKDDLRWRIEETRPWDRRDYDSSRFHRGPMTYREHREMRENSRDPRLIREKSRDRDRSNRESTESREPLDHESRDPRKEMTTKEKINPLKESRDPRLNRDRERGLYKNRYDSKFDQIYSATNKDESRSSFEASKKEKEAFMSPLDSLYAIKEEKKTGKGYGFQTFRIPKKKKDEKSSALMDKECKETDVNKELITIDLTDHNIINKTEVLEANVETSIKTPPSDTTTEIETSLIETVNLIETEEIKPLSTPAENSPELSPSEVKNTEESKPKITETESKTEENKPKIEENQSNSQATSSQIEENQPKTEEIKPTVDESKSKTPETKPLNEQTILASFFSNLLSSQNKKDKKTALYSLISTFSDTFSTKELAKITKIINNEEDDDVSDDNENSDKNKADLQKIETETDKNEIEINKDITEINETEIKNDQNGTNKNEIDTSKDEIKTVQNFEIDTEVKKNDAVDNKTTNLTEEHIQNEKVENVENDEEVIAPRISRRKLRSRRISSFSPTKHAVPTTKDVVNDKELLEEENIPENDDKEVLVSVGERIKSRKRLASSVEKTKKKSELDKLHEDIQEMFIRDGVLTASGKRMCNLLKEDPSVLTNDTLRASAEEVVKIRKKPGPKPKTKPSHPEPDEVRAMKNVRIVIQKIPDNTINERRLTRSMIAIENEEEEEEEENVSIVSEEGTDDDNSTESEKESPTPDNSKSNKTTKRKRSKSFWASGVIKKKKRKQLSEEPKTPDMPDEPSSTEDLLTKDIYVPSKEHYVDFQAQKSYPCKLCDFQGKFITTHYKIVHPDSEVISSRFSPSVAAEALEDAKINNSKYEKCQTVKGHKLKYICRFCSTNSTVPPTVFFDHLSTHTGEYRHICPNCGISFCGSKTLKHHMQQLHTDDAKPIFRKSYNTVTMFGYMCSECNYVQILEKNIEEHNKHYHCQKAVIHKINLSSYFDPDVEKLGTSEIKTPEKESLSNTGTSAEKTKKIRSKPGPKPKKKQTDLNKTITDTIPEKTESPKPRYLNRNDTILDTEKILPIKSTRAAKEKAQEKLKVMMEMNDTPSKKKTNDEEKSETSLVKAATPVINETSSETSVATVPTLSVEKELFIETSLDEINADTADKKVIKNEVDMNVFTCNTDLQEENKKIEQERLQKMDELNKSFGSRTSLNFIDKLCSRLNQNDVSIKKEPTDEFVDNIYQNVNSTDTSAIMPILEKNPRINLSTNIQIKKQILENTDSDLTTSNFDVSQKNDKSIINMIEKLKGKLGADDIFDVKGPDSDDLESDWPPPLTHVNDLSDLKTFDSTAQTLEVCGLLKVIKAHGSVTFCCLIPPCVFSTESKDQFQLHCKEHANLPERTSSLCETCGLEINATAEDSLLENVFKHTIMLHNDFMDVNADTDCLKPPTRMLRLRKLSGDALSAPKIIEESDSANTISDFETLIPSEVSQIPSELLVSDSEQSEPNPFGFKISDVKSLAEPQPSPPPLAPITKVALPILVKEAKLTQAELSKPKKSAKAMAKFIADVGNLYKCPYFNCLFSTNYREYLERHLKAHNKEKNLMVPCVYCDLKTPWEHVAIHIDIRHANCKYACSYCLYRACLKNYVFLHQDRVHSYEDYSVVTLPLSKKKFAIADHKIDPTSVCEPYRCLPACNKEFLFENEFSQHLNKVHQNYAICGHPNCQTRVPTSKMVQHWSAAHSVSTYQCGFCKMNANELNTMYHHLSMSHPNLNPEIYLRIITPLPVSPLGYTNEAFKKLRKIGDLPNIPESEKAETKIWMPKLTNTVKRSVPNAQKQIQIVTTNSPNSLTNIVEKITSPATTSPNNLFIVTSSPNPIFKINTVTHNSLQTDTSNLETSSSQKISLSPPLRNKVLNLPTVVVKENISTKSSPPPTSSISVQNELKHVEPNELEPVEPNELEPVEPNELEPVENNAEPVPPVEHVTLNEENNQEDIAELDVDPLDLGDPVTTQTTVYSSEDESDVTKSKKKFGLLSYQLYRCAFCEFSCTNTNDFRKHSAKSIQCRSNENLNKPFTCVHCKKPFKNSHILADHIQCHGILKFSCSLCEEKFPTSGQSRSHMKNRHNISQTTMSLVNNKIGEEYIIKPKVQLSKPQPKEVLPADSSAFTTPTTTDTVFHPDEVEKIPIRSIFSSDLRCAICTYSTKVRTNMVRHLQFHSQEIAVPDSAPVNPVPCLEKNEKMFDKMINLASSSHKTSRMGGNVKLESKDTENIPEFVPSNARYTCCAQNCNYICPEEGNLRHHLIALHDGETNFICVHCKTQLVPPEADSIIKHLKFHGLQLYKCGYCNFCHNLKHKIEKHCNDLHNDMASKVITIRNLETESTSSVDNTPTSTGQNSVPNKSNKPWRCLMCKYRSITEDAIQVHILEKHEIDSQYKCALCVYKSNDKQSFAGHFKEFHPDQEIDIILIYRKFEEDNKDDKEPTDNFDTTPLWQRDRPRIKHIRGILFDESSPTPSKSPKKLAKTPAQSNVKNITRNLDLAIESVVAGSASVLQEDSKIKVEDEVKKIQPESSVLSDTEEIIVIDDDDELSPKNKLPIKRKLPMEDTELKKKQAKIHKMLNFGRSEDADESLEMDLKNVFGSFGEPLHKQLKCPVCDKFKSKRISDFIFHLFKEKKIYRYKCKVCGDESITYRYMSKHVREHKEKFDPTDIIMMARNSRLELWLQMLIQSQCSKIVFLLPPTAEASAKDKFKVMCRYCKKWYKTEQERNEHAIKHWYKPPYKCGECPFFTFTIHQAEVHFKKCHPNCELHVQEVGPTVASELKYSDVTHLREVEEELKLMWIKPQISKETPITEVLVPSVSILDMIDESDQDGTVQGMIASEDPLVDVINPVEPAFEATDDLVIVTKTDTNVPHTGDVYCCEYCPYMSDSEPIMLSHISGQHEHMHIKFKVLNKETCKANQDEYVACSICHIVGSEIELRQHYTNKHDGETFTLYRFICNICTKTFLKSSGVKLHYQRVHPGVPINCRNICKTMISSNLAKENLTKEKPRLSDQQQPSRNLLSVLSPPPKPWKRYQCTECSYQRDFSSRSVNNVRSHVRTHFKAFLCGECGLHFNSKGDAKYHFQKDHTNMVENIIYEKETDRSFQECIRIVLSEAIPIPIPGNDSPSSTSTKCSSKIRAKGTPTARKSTSAACSQPMEEFSYYGHPIEKEDFSNIMTSVELHGIYLDMTADKLAKLFNLNPTVSLTRCDSFESDVIEIDES